MRAYLAILKDSFREAFSSRVLWVLLGLITILLAVVAPLRLKDEVAADIRRGDFIDSRGFVSKLVAAGKDAAPSPAKSIWKHIEKDDLRSRLQEAIASTEQRSEKFGDALDDLRKDLNRQLTLKDFYEPAAWPAPAETSTAGVMLARGIDTLSSDDLRRMNRLLLDSNFRGLVMPAPEKAVSLQYFYWPVGSTWPFRPKETELLIRTALAGIISFFVGTLGVFVGILVTSMIVPNTYEPGSIDLLLSKPVSRSLVFVTKFFGALAFILILAVYFILGVWLIAGFQFRTWMVQLWYCIPVFMFLFAIYYSVSAVSGLVWRNAVISVVMTIFFWLTCFTVGTARQVISSVFLDNVRLNRSLTVDDKLVVTDRSGKILEWNAEDKSWDEIAKLNGQRELPFGLGGEKVGVLYDPKSELLIYANKPFGGPRFMQSSKLVVAKRRDDWKASELVEMPANTGDMTFDNQGRLLVCSTSGLFRFDGDLAAALAAGDAPKLFGFKIPTLAKRAGFESVMAAGPAAWGIPFSSSYDPAGNRVAVVADNQLRLLTANADDKFEDASTIDLGEAEEPVVGCGPGGICVAESSGRVRLFQIADSSVSFDSSPVGKIAAAAVSVSPKSSLVAVRFENKRVWLFDTAKKQDLSKALTGQGDISGLNFTSDGNLLVADRLNRITSYTFDGETLQRGTATAPSANTLELVFWYIIEPIYYVFPKPGELDNVVAAVMNDGETQLTELDNSRRDGRRQRMQLDIWQPIWSSAAFLVVMLAIGSLYVARKDF